MVREKGNGKEKDVVERTAGETRGKRGGNAGETREKRCLAPQEAVSRYFLSALKGLRVPRELRNVGKMA
jgi:hypothetical protein